MFLSEEDSYRQYDQSQTASNSHQQQHQRNPLFMDIRANHWDEVIRILFLLYFEKLDACVGEKERDRAGAGAKGN